MRFNAALPFLSVMLLCGPPALAYYHGSPRPCANGSTYPDGCNSLGTDNAASVTSSSNVLTVSSSVSGFIDIGMCVYDGSSCSSGGPNIPPYTYIYARGTGTGGQGTYFMTANAMGSSSPVETVTARAVAPIPAPASFQCGGVNGITSVGMITPGSGGPAGPTTYKFVPLSGGTGYAAMANVTVSDGRVTRVVITGSGAAFTAGDTLTNVSVADNLGGVSGFSFKVGSVGRNYACSLQFPNFFSASCYTTAISTGDYDGCAAQSGRMAYNSSDAYDLSKINYNPSGILYPVGVDYSTLPSFDIGLQRLSQVTNKSQPNVPGGCRWNNRYYALYCMMPAGSTFVINGFDFQDGVSLYLEALTRVPCVVMNSSFYPGQSGLGQMAIVHADGCSSLAVINNVIDGLKLTNNSLSEIFLASNTTSEVFEYNAIMHLPSRFDEEGTYDAHLWAFNYADGLIYYGPNQNNNYQPNVHGEYYFGWYTYVSHVYNVIAGPQDANQSNAAYLYPFNVIGGHGWSWFGCAISTKPTQIYVGYLDTGTISAPGGNGQPAVGDGDIHVIPVNNWGWPTWITNGVANGGPGGATPTGGTGLYNVIASVNPGHDQPCAMTTPTGGTIDQPGWIGTFSGISGSGAGGATYNNVQLVDSTTPAASGTGQVQVVTNSDGTIKSVAVQPITNGGVNYYGSAYMAGDSVSGSTFGMSFTGTILATSSRLTVASGGIDQTTWGNGQFSRDQYLQGYNNLPNIGTVKLGYQVTGTPGGAGTYGIRAAVASGSGTYVGLNGNGGWTGSRGSGMGRSNFVSAMSTPAPSGGSTVYIDHNIFIANLYDGIAAAYSTKGVEIAGVYMNQYTFTNNSTEAIGMLFCTWITSGAGVHNSETNTVYKGDYIFFTTKSDVSSPWNYPQRKPERAPGTCYTGSGI